MFDNIDVQEAVKRALLTEKNAMNFYDLGAQRMTNPEARRVFNLLAREERGHAQQFFGIYQGGDIPSFDVFIDSPADHESAWLSALAKAIDTDFSEKKALELAMEKELSLEKTLRETAEQIAVPEVKAIFELNAKETHNHYELIESEYANLMGMVHESDMDTFVRE
jgi:rubrerythrin